MVANKTTIHQDTASHNILHRTLKLELEEGVVATISDAEQLTRDYVLQIAVGEDVETSLTRQAILLTAVNAGVRAFRGGVRLVGNLSWDLKSSWGAGRGIEAVIHEYDGAQIVSTLSPEHPTIIIGNQLPVEIIGSIIVIPTWEGWTGGVVISDTGRLPESTEFPLAGVLSGALSVAECFGHVRGEVKCGRREVGLSLWDLEAPWRSGLYGQPLRYLPTRLWILGLGHVGQACIWSLGFLPYVDPSEVELWVQDYDHVVPANVSTGLLIKGSDIGEQKTRVVAQAIGSLGMRSRLIERRFDDRVHLQNNEPRWALVGFDSANSRRSVQIGPNQFEVVIDIGLGTSSDYRGFHVHLFPSAGTPSKIFSNKTVNTFSPPSSWAVNESNDRCGAISLGNVSVGAAFVGATAAVVGLAEILRTLAGFPLNARLVWSLQSPESAVQVWNGTRYLPRNPGYQDVASDAY